MSEHGAALQTYNQELVKCLDDLKSKRSEVMDIIGKHEAEKNIQEKNLRIIQDKLATLRQSLEYYRSMFDSYDKTIKETELGFRKILESSQTLLQVAQQESNKLDSNNLDKSVLFNSFN